MSAELSRGDGVQEVEAAWDRRHHWGAPRISALLHDMSGFYVKSAQILASKPDFLPAQVQLVPLLRIYLFIIYSFIYLFHYLFAEGENTGKGGGGGEKLRFV